MISDKLKIAVKLDEKRNYEIAHQAGIHPSTLSKIICGIETVKAGDPRVIEVGKVLGIPAVECFQKDE